ncbi:hypothetical protein [Aristaeella hokkaidonensis]|uniref:Uncharacterized protein n=1 Tax=Aristaeella hokkaidonensis TaxID=3046382 RepID=A0AC61NJS9_9FIRM|nr:hypothetical protein [Aristaeella hokkaidonensis]QUC66128.1 hypothetical protein JYE49_09630 [Aristaeella hokkaidonensis]SNT94866.1 hypothetical protein SAMN06297421_10795 [Aristaeella hokkaidonensis]
MKRAIAFILSLMMVLSVLATGLAGEVSAAEDLAFTLPEIIPAKGIEDFIGEWVFYLVAAKDGRTMTREEMLATEQVDDKANVTISEDTLIIYAPSTGELAPVKVEFNAENGSLKAINEEADSTTVIYLTDNGMLVFFEPDDVTREGAVYLTRIEEENG